MQQRPAPCRHIARGFTLLELMVVIGVIALLVGISYTVIGGALDTAKRTATLTTIAKIDRVYHQKLGGFYRHLDAEKARTKQLSGKFRRGIYHFTDNDSASVAMARKDQVKVQFPQHRDETYGFDDTPNNNDPGEQAAFKEWTMAHASSPPSPADSAELLYLIVTESTIPGAQVVDTTEFSESELGDTDGDNWIELIDAWGEPLRFYRWPTRLVNPFGYAFGRLDSAISATDSSIPLRTGDGAGFNSALTALQGVDPTATILVSIGDEIIEINGVAGDSLSVATRGAKSTDKSPHTAGTLVKIAPFADLASLLLGSVNTSVLSKDHDDLFGVLADPRNLIISTPGGAVPRLLDFEDYFHTFSSHAPPLIISVGPDRELGLREPFEVASNGHLAIPLGNTLAEVAASVINASRGDSPLVDNLTNHMEGLGN